MKEVAERKKTAIHHGKNITIARDMLNISQEGLASILEVSQKQISRYENEKTIDDEILNKIANAMSINVDFLKTFSKEDVTHFSQNANNNAEGKLENQNIKVEGNLNQTKYPIDQLEAAYKKLLREKDTRIRELLGTIRDKEKEIKHLKNN